MLQYFLEKLINIHTLRLFIFSPPSYGTSSTITPTIGIGSSSVTIKWGSDELCIRLTVFVDASKASCCTNTDCLDIKLPFVDQPCVEIMDDEPQPLALAEVNTLCCRTCKNPFILNPINKVLSLPSPHWLELADMWLCLCCNPSNAHHNHDHQGLNHQHPTLPLNQDIQAKPNCCLVGTTHILLHVSNIQGIHPVANHSGDKINIYGELNTNSSRGWIFVGCVSCSATIGFAQQVGNHDSTEEKPNMLNYKLYKHALLSFSNANNSYFSEYSIETLCAATILSASQTDTCYKFLVVDFPPSACGIQVTLINWDGFLESNRPTVYGGQPGKMIPVLKVLYKCTSNSSERDTACTNSSWKAKNNPKMITLFPTELALLRDLLQTSTQMLPVSAQTFIGGDKVGFLRLAT